MSISFLLPERSGKGRHNSQGFALPEVLIAAVIAAAVLAASANALSTSLRGAKATSDAVVVLRQAENIAARLKAGLPIDDLLGDDWTIERTRIENETPQTLPTYLEDIHVSRTAPPAMSFHVYVIRETAR